MAKRISPAITPWHAAALAGGVALGVLGSRLLPPVVAQASGSMRATFRRDPFRPLESDHRLIESTLAEMVEATTGSTAQRLKLFLLFKRKLAKHAMAEEDVVYPVLYDIAGAEDKARELYDEHAQMKIHLFSLERALDSGPSWGDHVRRLQDIVLSHIRDEEEVEFPRLRTILAEKEHSKIAGKILREEALVL
jgi:hemerythrin superfamily protein